MTSSTRRPVVTLDGPAGAGKTSTAKEVARRLGLRHLDSGALYRALTFALRQKGIPEARWPDLDEDDLRALGVSLVRTEGGFEVRHEERVLDHELRTSEVTSRVSLLASIPAVRACLLELQRAAGKGGGLVADGRDMGTVVFPDAEVKVFLVADLHERARRRILQAGSGPANAETLAAEAEAIALRDDRDSGRDISPLRRPEGAVEIDTTALSFDEQADEIVDLVRRLTL
ncbi:MAG: (d)CMP kinase [Gemmatimonadota bacterium]|nr:(d)CMP kinase [Gemmatimonadota bacterium]